MKNKNYLEELKSKLTRLENNTKNEILKEIESYIQESNASYETLIEKFGTPDKLAQSYLEDMPKITPIKEKTVTFMSRFLRIIGASLVFMMVAILIFVYFISQDEFDYGKYTSETIDKKINTHWIKAKGIEHIKLKQTKTVIYWSENQYLEYSCKENIKAPNSNTLSLGQSLCYIKVPKSSLSFSLYQANVVMVEPTANITFKSDQSKIQIANYNIQNTYKYELESDASEVENLNSKDNATVIIKGTLNQSVINLYTY